MRNSDNIKARKGQFLFHLVLGIGLLFAGMLSGAYPGGATAIADTATSTVTAATSTSSTTVNVLNGSFSPRNLTILPGTIVTWINMGSVNHTVTADNELFDSGMMTPSSTYSLIFHATGTYPYYCRPHGGPGGVGMAGVITVAEQSATSTSATTTAPIALNSAASTTLNTPISGMLGGHDTNIPSRVLMYSIAANPMNGSVSVNPSFGIYTYTPNAGFTGTDSFTFLLNNGILNSNAGIQTIMVSGTSTPAGAATSTATGTATSTSGIVSSDFLARLENLINELRRQIESLRAQIQSFLAERQALMGNATSTSIPWWGGHPPTGAPTIEVSNQIVRAGTTIDFGGRNWGFREQIFITSGGSDAGRALTDDGGNWSTGSLTVPTTLGIKTYDFRGAGSGISKSITITIIP